MRRSLIVILALAAMTAAACDNDLTDLDTTAAAVQILGISDSLQFGTTANATVEVRNADGVVLQNYPLQWSSSRPEVLSVSSSGQITAARPGSAYIRARVGTVTDSVRIGVLMSCSPPHFLLDVGSHFSDAWVAAGFLDDGHGVPVPYMDTQAIYAGGVMFGTDSATLVAGRSPASRFHDLRGSVCDVQDAHAYHSVSLVTSTRPTVPGLVVVQDVYAFNTQATDDFMLFSYTFTNEGAAPIIGLSVAMNTDFDLYDSSNVANFDATTGVADVVAPDSVANPFVVGMLAVDESVTAYRAYGLGGPTESRDILYGYISGGIEGPARTGPMDIRQIMAVAPFDLQPGATRTVWFAIVGGENRAAFNTHVTQAIAMARFLD